MSNRKQSDEKAAEFFDQLWSKGDPWHFDSSPFEPQRLARLIDAIQGRQYANALEIGCGSGTFTRMLAPLTGRLVAMDVAQSAIAAAQAAPVPAGVEYRLANIMDYDPRTDGPWDLVVLSETIYYLGWLYSFFEVAWMAVQLFEATRPGGRILVANTYGDMDDYLVRPWIIRTYRDLFTNVGYRCETESVFTGNKDNATVDVLMSVFIKP